ncbi:type IV pilus modification protein PilV [Chromohalobacter israelensis]|uniref:type IV pilus modification protein PilV n=1 Tax=Chromohalobacter israelensis TaxID=141390 RepID=UPI001F0B729C|nr:type IV pilus modification protein PilV [Chromohalobacter salexigens]
MMAPPLQSSPHAQRGFGLIEVLVALTILSIGMLGLAAMQLTSLQAARESLDTTIATIMVRDMNERAWAQQNDECNKLDRLAGKWKSYVKTTAPMSNAIPNIAYFAGPGNTASGRYYSLTIEWAGGDDNAVELVIFLPCKETASE